MYLCDISHQLYPEIVVLSILKYTGILLIYYRTKPVIETVFVLQAELLVQSTAMSAELNKLTAELGDLQKVCLSRDVRL